MTRLTPDPDDLDRVLSDLSVRHGDMHVSMPDLHGTVTITCEDGRVFRMTAQGSVSASSQRTISGYHALKAAYDA